MTKDCIVFGTGDFADIVSYVMEKRLRYRIAAYTVSRVFLKDRVLSYQGKPLVEFETIEEQYPPEDYEFVIGMIGKKMFDQRSTLFNRIRKKGYDLPNVIDPRACVDTELIGKGNIILANVSIEKHCRIGSGNIIWQNVVMPHHNRVGSFNNLAPSVSLSGYSVVGNHCFIGNNVCIKNHVAIDDYAYIGAGSYVAHTVKTKEVLVPHPSYVLDGKTGFDFL